MFRPLLALSVALPLLSSTAAAAPAEVVKLRFAWPAGAEASVAYVRERARTGQEPVTSKVTYAERVERRGEEHWVWASGTAVDLVDVPGASAADAAAIAGEVAKVAEGMARVVGPDGAFRRVEGLDRAIPGLLEVLAKRSPPGAREAVGRMGPTMAAVGQASAQTQWAYAVGQWAGEEFELGADYEASSRTETPLAPGQPIDYRITFRVERRLPCDGEAGPPRCVEITLRSAPDPKALPVLVEAMTRRLLAQAAPGTKLPEGVSFKEAGMVDEVRLVTDPATLQPRRVSWVRTVRVVTSDGKKESAKEQRDAKTWLYTWKGGQK